MVLHSLHMLLLNLPPSHVNLFEQNGPNTFDKASKMLEDHRNVQAPLAHDKGPPNSQVSSLSNERHNVTASLHDPNARSLPYSQMDIGTNKSESSGPSHSELRPTGMEIVHMRWQNL